MSKKLTYERYQWFLAELKAGRHPNARSLAEGMEISLPQAQRDIEFMRERLRTPIHYDSGCKGYVLANQGFELPSVWIRDEELLLLALARELFLDSEAKAVLRELFLKIAQCSSSDLETILRFVSYKGTGHYPVKEGILNRTIEALLKKKQIEIDYLHVYSPGQDASRVLLSPLHLIFYRGNWYLLALRGGSLRTYALSRMDSLRICPEAVQDSLPEGEIKATIEKSFGIFVTEEGHAAERIRLKFSPQIAGFVRSTVYHPEQQIEELPGGSIVLSFPSTLNRELVGEILSFGSDVSVLHPEALRAEIRRILKEALRASTP